MNYLARLFIIAVAYFYEIAGHPLDRYRRFMTPTTYPVPTFPQNGNPTPTIPFVLTARPGLGVQPLQTRPVPNVPHQSINCPTKRDVSIPRVVLDDIMLRDMYTDMIGNLNTKYLALTMTDAIKNRFRNLLSTWTKKRGTAMLKQELTANATVNEDLEKFNTWYASVIQSMDGNPTLEAILEGVNITMAQLKDVLDLKTDIDVINNLHLKQNRTTRNYNVSSHQRYKRVATPAEGGYLHLCKTRGITRMFADDRFPRVTTEYACDINNCNCMTLGGTSHGQCRTVTQNVKMLRLKPGGCRLVIQNGTQVIVDEWDVYDQPLHVGCECVINKNSALVINGIIGKR